MPAYTIAKDATDSAAPSPLATVTPGASVGVAVTGVYSAVLETGAAGDRLQLFRSTTGTTPVAATPEKLNSRQSAAGSTCASDWTTPPTAVGNPVILMGRSVGTAIVMQRRWVSHPRFPLIEMPSGSKFHYGTVVSNGVNEGRTLSFVEPSRDVPPIGRFRGRRGTEPGGFFVQDNSRGFHGLSTAPQSCPGSTGYTFVNSLDWPESVLGGMGVFLNLLNGAAGGGVDLAGDIAGAAVLTADLSLAEALAGGIAGQGTLTANLVLAEALAGAIAGQGTLAADLRLAEALAGSISGQGTLTADLREAIALAGNLAGAATLTGNLSLAVALAGAIAGQATLSASLVEAIALSGNIAGIASLAATLALAEALAGNIAGQATLTGDVQTGTPLAGHVAGAALVTADLSLAVALAGNIAGTATITGRLSLPGGAVTYTVFVFDD